MRVSHRLILVACLAAMVVLGRDGSAQDPYAAPRGGAGLEAVPSPPVSMMPYPSNSMYDYEYDKHFHKDGLWHRIASNRGRRFVFNLDLLTGMIPGSKGARTRRPEGRVGHPGAQSYKDLVLPILEEDPYDLGDGGGGGGGGSSQEQSVVDQFRGMPEQGIPGFNLYDSVSLGNTMSHLSGLGMRIQAGYFDPDESGLMFEAFGHSLEEHYDARDDLGPGRGKDKALLMQLLSPPDYLSNLDQGTPEGADQVADPILQNNLLNLRGLPLDDGSSAGVSSPFDLEFQLTAKSRTYGTSVNWILPPAYQTRTFMIRPMFGVRYLRVSESFRFYGQDSGLSYDNLEDLDEPFNGDIKLHSPPDKMDNDRDGIVDSAGKVEETDTQGGGGGGGGNQDDEYRFIIYNDMTMYPINSFLNNVARSDLIGPEVGVRYDLGGKKFKLWGRTKFGVLANKEQMVMDGDNIGMVTRQTDFNMPSPENARPNRFSDQDRHTHVSPVIEQSIFIEAPIFAKLPVLKRSRVLKDAYLRFGYTFLWIGEVARPYQSVLWQGNPSEGLYPSIDMERSNYWAENWSWSINWSF